MKRTTKTKVAMSEGSYIKRIKEGYLCWVDVSHREIQQLIRPYQHFGKLCRGIVNWFMPLPQGTSTPQVE